jgi:hypothetical protein
MNRSTFILGIALLVVAVTMAVTITVRNAPDEAAERGVVAQKAANHGFSRKGSSFAPGRSMRSSARSSARRSGVGETARRPAFRERYRVVVPADRQEELRSRAALVETKARRQLERMTRELELTTAQRRKMFPLLVRSAHGYDPAMQVAGVAGPTDPSASTDEEIHALLDPEQQMALEEEEVNRRLWWQDLIGRLEKELDESTGGAETPSPSDATPESDPGSSAPPGRPTGNLLDPPASPSAPPARPTGSLLDPSE